jgi:hypothetical protein
MATKALTYTIDAESRRVEFFTGQFCRGWLSCRDLTHIDLRLVRMCSIAWNIAGMAESQIEQTISIARDELIDLGLISA